MSELTSRLDSFFGASGALARAHSAHEHRPEQIAMATEVLGALENGEHLVVEAGTGVGKTLAYLVPAILRGGRLIVSTGTKTLQDQIALKDIPFLRDACRLKVRAAVVKGRDNYLCRHRFEQFKQQPLFEVGAEGRHWDQVQRWAEHTALGDVSELSELPDSPRFWMDINARQATCSGARCPQASACHLEDVRTAARAADIIIVNHHLYLADAALRGSELGSVLPEADAVIFDEAHRLESAATSFFGVTVSNWRLKDLGDDVARTLARVDALAASTRDRAARVSETAMRLGLPWGAEGRWPLPARLSFAQDDALADAHAAMKELEKALAPLVERTPDAIPLHRRASDLAQDLETLIRRNDPAWVYWFEVRGRGVSLSATPVDVAAILRQNVFGTLRASVLCSATLAIGGSMRHARARLGLDAPVPVATPDDGDVHDIRADAIALVVRESIHASPFDHARQGLLYLPSKMPDPRHRDWSPGCADAMRSLVRASGGRAFLLFTSHDNLRRVHSILADEIEHPVLMQGDAPKHALLERFKESGDAVLFATSSFWEGVDVPGPALSLVVMDRLPFGVPSDPIVAARSRLVEDAGGDAFRDLALPEAILALKQGAGRLIRSKSDRGVVAILDPRIRTAYGRKFLRDLPPWPTTSSLDEVTAFFAAAPEAQTGREPLAPR